MAYDAYTFSFFHSLRLETNGHQGPEAEAEDGTMDAGQEARLWVRGSVGTLSSAACSPF